MMLGSHDGRGDFQWIQTDVDNDDLDVTISKTVSKETFDLGAILHDQRIYVNQLRR